MEKKIFTLSLILCIPVLFAYQPTEEISSRQIITKMYASIEKISTLKFKLKKKERIGAELRLGEQDVKFNRTPKKVYTKVMAPNAGAEVLFVEGQNNNKVYVNPNAFPYMTLSIDPYSSTLRKNNHHTIHEVGFDYINSIVAQIAQKSAKDFEKYFIYKEDVVFDKRNCYKLVIDYTPFDYISYTVKEGETVTSIAYKLFISDYMILQLNANIDDYDDVNAGDIIKIPNAYAKKTILYIDKENFLPLGQYMYDEKGLFAQYEFYNLQLNPKFTDNEFSKDYKDYNF